MTIDTFHKVINQRLRKERGGFLSPEAIDLEVNLAQNVVFEKYKPIFAINQQAQDALAPFKKDYTINNGNSASGLITLPADYYHLLSIETVVVDDDGTHYIGVEQLGEDEISDRKNSALIPQTVYNPFGRMLAPSTPYGQYRFQIYPAQATAGTLYYLRKPATVQYAYTITNGRPVYNSGSSVQPEWNEPLCIEVLNQALANLGLAVQDMAAIQMAKSEGN